MNASTEAPAPPDHNKGPLYTTEKAILAYLGNQYGDIVERAKALLGREADFATVKDDESDSEATEFMVKVRAAWKAADGARVTEKSPYDDLAGLVHGWFKAPVLDPLQAMGVRINEAQTVYKVSVLQAEQETRADNLRKQQAAEKKAADDAAAAAKVAAEALAAANRARNPERKAELTAAVEAAVVVAEKTGQVFNDASRGRSEAQEALAAPAADLTRSRGSRGGVSSLASFHDFRDLDRAVLGELLDKDGKKAKGVVPPGILTLLPYIDEKHLDMAVRAYMAANKATVDAHIAAKTQPINGVVIFENYRNRGHK